MDKFDIRSAKLVSIICLILFIFIMVIANAYKYLPEDNSAQQNTANEIILPADNEDANENDEVQSEEPQEEKNISLKKTTEDILPAKNEVPPLESFSEDEQLNAEQPEEVQETYASVIESANQLKNNKQLVQAIDEYKKALTLAVSNKEKAICYEEISTIYAITKKYGTALSYAQKAYNLSPSSSREMLLARLYFKTGATDKASERVNNVLRRDFAQDN